jgi:hypothetical protein
MQNIPAKNGLELKPMNHNQTRRSIFLATRIS